MITEKLIQPQVTHVRVYVLRAILEIIVKLKVIGYFFSVFFCNVYLFYFRENIFDNIYFILDPCTAITCNDHGKVDTAADDTCACVCFEGYSGDICETAGNWLFYFFFLMLIYSILGKKYLIIFISF